MGSPSEAESVSRESRTVDKETSKCVYVRVEQAVVGFIQQLIYSRTTVKVIPSCDGSRQGGALAQLKVCVYEDDFNARFIYSLQVISLSDFFMDLVKFDTGETGNTKSTKRYLWLCLGFWCMLDQRRLYWSRLNHM